MLLTLFFFLFLIPPFGVWDLSSGVKLTRSKISPKLTLKLSWRVPTNIRPAVEPVILLVRLSSQNFITLGNLYIIFELPSVFLVSIRTRKCLMLWVYAIAPPHLPLLPLKASKNCYLSSRKKKNVVGLRSCTLTPLLSKGLTNTFFFVPNFLIGFTVPVSLGPSKMKFTL